jgi:Endonuclease/Exonuclease/phosphatase family 2
LTKLSPVVGLELERLHNFGLYGQIAGDSAEPRFGDFDHRFRLLDPSVPISHHDIALGECVFLRHMTPLSRDDIAHTDDVAVDFTFCQIKQLWLRGVLAVLDADAVVELASLVAQGTFGNPNAATADKPNFLAQKIGGDFPDSIRGHEEAIMASWRTRAVDSRATAKFLFMVTCRRPLVSPFVSPIPGGNRAPAATATKSRLTKPGRMAGISRLAGKLKGDASPAPHRAGTHHDTMNPNVQVQPAGPLEVSVRGMTRKKVPQSKKVHVTFDLAALSVTFFELDSGRLVLQLTHGQLDCTMNPTLRVERNPTDFSSLSLVNYRDSERFGDSPHSCDISCRSVGECDYLRGFLNRCRGIGARAARVWTGTWNLGGAPPPALHDWLPAQTPEPSKTGSAFASSANFDLIVVATQEAKWSKGAEKKAAHASISREFEESSSAHSHAASAQSAIIAPTAAAIESADAVKPAAEAVASTDNFLTRVHHHIGADRFEVLGTVSMWEIALTIYVARDVRHLCTGITSATKPTGIANVCGNKGGVAISFCFLETSLCFANSHLPARHTPERLASRNFDYRWLVESLAVGATGRGANLLNQFDHLFWLGDLNYRVDLSRERIEQHCADVNCAALISADQLRAQIAEDRAFSGFCEGTVGFVPTYRWERGKREWSKKKLQNVPSYTDRILWKSNASPLDVIQREYRCADTMMTSDHRPVSGVFNVVTHLTIADAFRSSPPAQLCVAVVVFYDLEVILLRQENMALKKFPDAHEKDLIAKFSFPGQKVTLNTVVFRRDRLRNRWMPNDPVVVGPFQTVSPHFQQSIRARFNLLGESNKLGQSERVGTTLIRTCTEVPHTPDMTEPMCHPFMSTIQSRGVVWGELHGSIDVMLFSTDR